MNDTPPPSGHGMGRRVTGPALDSFLRGPDLTRADFLKFSAAATVSMLWARRSFAGAAAPAGRTSPARGDWFRRQPRIYLVDFQLPDPADQAVPGMPRFLENLDPERLVRDVLAANANGMLVHTKCHEGNAYYNTRVGHKHSGLGARDLLAELSPLCRHHGLTLLFYYSIAWEQRAFVEHPDWRGVDPDGTERVRPLAEPLHPNNNQRWSVCVNTGYRDYVTAMLTELSSGYDFDGYWLDMPASVCYCATCRADFRRATGLEVPSGASDSDEGRAFRRWWLARNTEIHTGFVSTIHRINSRLTVSSNGVPFHSDHPYEAGEPQDYLSREYHYPEGPQAVSLYGRKFWAAKPGTPFELEIWRYAFSGRQSYSRAFQVRPSEVLLTEMAGVVANGGWPQYYDQIRMDGTLDPWSIAAVAPAFAAVRDRQPWANIGSPVPYALVLWSKETETWVEGTPRRLAVDGLEGAHNSLVERRVPVGVITAPAIERREWRGARVIVLPSAECLSDAAAAALREFVEAGGGLVVTGRTSLRDEEGRERANFALADLIGAEFAGMTKTWLTFFSLPGTHAVTRNLPAEFPIAVNETLQTIVRARAGAVALGAIHEPVPGFKMGSAPGPATTAPALIVREVGRGRVVYATAELGAMYFRFSLPSVRQLIVDAVTWAAGAPPPISARAPETVEVVGWRDASARRTILHVINRTGAGLGQTPGQMMHEVIPLHEIEINVTAELAGRRVVAQPGRRSLSTRRSSDGGLTILIPRLEAWEVIEIT